jgi:hypothetical protein
MAYMAEDFSSMFEALGSIPSIERKERCLNTLKGKEKFA